MKLKEKLLYGEDWRQSLPTESLNIEVLLLHMGGNTICPDLSCVRRNCYLKTKANFDMNG